MNPDSFHENEEQREQHLRAIQTLIKEGRRPEEEITRLYTLVLQEYERNARVKTFLPILITKRVKEMIESESQ
jgi:hypothetical protein